MVRNNTRGSLPAWEKPVDQGSNPCVPTPPFGTMGSWADSGRFSLHATFAAGDPRPKLLIDGPPLREPVGGGTAPGGPRHLNRQTQGPGVISRPAILRALRSKTTRG